MKEIASIEAIPPELYLPLLVKTIETGFHITLKLLKERKYPL